MKLCHPYKLCQTHFRETTFTYFKTVEEQNHFSGKCQKLNPIPKGTQTKPNQSRVELSFSGPSTRCHNLLNDNQKSWYLVVIRVSQSVTWMALCEQVCGGAVLTELQDEESVWAEPVDEGLPC